VPKIIKCSEKEKGLLLSLGTLHQPATAAPTPGAQGWHRGRGAQQHRGIVGAQELAPVRYAQVVPGGPAPPLAGELRRRLQRRPLAPLRTGHTPKQAPCPSASVPLCPSGPVPLCLCCLCSPVPLCPSTRAIALLPKPARPLAPPAPSLSLSLFFPALCLPQCRFLWAWGVPSTQPTPASWTLTWRSPSLGSWPWPAGTSLWGARTRGSWCACSCSTPPGCSSTLPASGGRNLGGS